MTNEELWQSAMGEIELSISRANFITWFKNTKILSNENGKIVIGVPNGFAKEWLENKYKNYIIKALQNFEKDIREISCKIHIPQFNGFNKAKSVDAIKNPVDLVVSAKSRNIKLIIRTSIVYPSTNRR